MYDFCFHSLYENIFEINFEKCCPLALVLAWDDLHRDKILVISDNNDYGTMQGGLRVKNVQGIPT